MCVQEVLFIRREVAGSLLLQHGHDLDHLPGCSDVDGRLRLIRIAQHAQRHVRLGDERLNKVGEGRPRMLPSGTKIRLSVTLICSFCGLLSLGKSISNAINSLESYHDRFSVLWKNESIRIQASLAALFT